MDSMKLLSYAPFESKHVARWSASKVKVKPAGCSSCLVVLDGHFENVEMVVNACKMCRNRLGYLYLNT